MDLQSVKQRFGIIGNSPALNRAIEVALRVAPTDLSVLISGESGVGKEFFPQIIHAYSARKHGAYIAVNCGAIPEGTIDSELFGHEKGSFTGATDNRKGYFEVANGGTIFLDEAAELPLQTQVRLLRILQSGEFIKVGSSKVQKTDVRVVAATNVDLRAAVDTGRFREDLYYRLNTVPINVPSLRERKEDICLLFRKFASDIAAQYRMPAIALTPDTRQTLEEYSWPGNIRQLKNVAEQISAIEERREIDRRTLTKYLPNFGVSTVPMVYRAGPSTTDPTTERDILYKLLFDLRGEVSELKSMVAGMNAERHGSTQVQAHISGQQLPRVISHGSSGPDDYIEPEEVNDQQDEGPKTKDDAIREAIVKALEKHHGRRKDAAAELFISERTLYRKIKELGIDK